MDEARQKRGEVLLIVGLTGGSDSSLGATVERVEGGDNLVGAIAVQLAVAPRQLHRPLDGLGAAVAKEHQVEAAVLDQRFGELQLRYSVELVGGLDQRARLLGNGLGDDRVAVAQLVYGPPGNEVQILLAVGVPDLCAVATDDNHRLAAHRLGVIFLFNVDPVAADAHYESSTPDSPSARFRPNVCPEIIAYPPESFTRWRRGEGKA